MLCSVFLLGPVLIFVGNLPTFLVFASEKPLRKKSLLLVINMAFADAILEAVSMPLYVFLWIRPGYGIIKRNCPWISLGVSLMPPSPKGSLISGAAIAF